jgi:N6-L-threonylcarbamoyladenine synthase
MNKQSAILGIESSCDETSAAIVVNGKELLSNVVASQDSLHEKFGGVIPEIACRAHLNAMLPVIQEAFDRSGLQKEDIDAVAVSNRPGLVGSLLIGLTFAKSFSCAMQVPLIGINHLEAHIYAAHLEHEIELPAVSLVVSGGHTALYISEDLTTYILLGSTIDDAAGEAFDKVASILGLGYPGGPVIDKAARNGSSSRFNFPRTFIKDDNLKFSFSGLKTAVLYHCQGHSSGRTKLRDIDDQERNDIAASFQEAVVDVLVAKVIKTAKKHNARSICIGGGVACNSRLRERIRDESICDVYIPSPALCMDNGAMIAGLGYHKLKQGKEDDLFLDADSQPVRMGRE